MENNFTKVYNVINIDGTIAVKGKLLQLNKESFSPDGTQLIVGDRPIYPIIISEEEISVDGLDLKWLIGIPFYQPSLNKVRMGDRSEICGKFCIGGMLFDNDNKSLITRDYKKVLAVPENFPVDLLQKVAIGELKIGDEIFIECEEIPDAIESINKMTLLDEEGKKDLLKLCNKKIKLNNQNHIIPITITEQK